MKKRYVSEIWQRIKRKILRKSKKQSKAEKSATPVCDALKKCANSAEEASESFKKLQETAERATVPSQDMIDAMRYAFLVAKKAKIEQIKRNAVPTDYGKEPKPKTSIRITNDGIFFCNNEEEPVAYFTDQKLAIRQDKPKRIRCQYCGCLSEKDYGTCAHCGAPL